MSGFGELFRNKLLLLWSAVTALIVGVASMLSFGYVNFMDVEKERLIHRAEMVNDTLVWHTIQVTGQVDTILRSVRGFYLRTRSVVETESFIRALDFDRSVIDNIYLIASDGRIILSNDPATMGPSVSDREYFKFHRSTETDRIFISPVEQGRITGKHHFRITRRISNHDGSFGGLVLATVSPESFTRYYNSLTVGSQNFASLLGISDRKLRARVPEPPVERWSEAVDSPLWGALQKTPSGHYENISQVDNIRRLFVFSKVGTLPLVMVSGFSHDDLKHGVHERMIWLVSASLGILFFVILLALLLTIEAKRRDEQRQAADAREKRDRQFRDLFDNAPIGIFHSTREGRFVVTNPVLVKMLGYSTPEELITATTDMTTQIYADPEKRPQIMAALMEQGGWVHYEDVIWRRKDGRLITVDMSGRQVLDGTGALEYLEGFTVDITERKRTEEALEEERRQLRQAFDEIKTLRGIVPICSYCKKIRDDEGYWNQVEQYVSKHTEAKFSHGICPACFEREMKGIETSDG